MTRNEFTSLRASVHKQITLEDGRSQWWTFFWPTVFAMMVAIPVLAVMTVVALFLGWPWLTFLEELGCCLVMAALLKFCYTRKEREWAAIARENGLICPSCGVSIYYKGDEVLETGRCWSCEASVFSDLKF